MSPVDAMRRIDALLSHVWVVRTFLKHSEEAAEDDDLMEIVRTLYDGLLALGPAWQAQDADAYLKLLRKKLPKLQHAAAEFARLQPEISVHTNFKMAVLSLQTALQDVASVLHECG